MLTFKLHMFVCVQVQRTGSRRRRGSSARCGDTGGGDGVSHLLLWRHLQWQDAQLQHPGERQSVVTCQMSNIFTKQFSHNPSYLTVKGNKLNNYFLSTNEILSFDWCEIWPFLQISPDTKKPRPKSLAISTPTRLLSLEEARQRSLGTHLVPSHNKFIDVGGGPKNLPDKYHTVIDLPGYR